VRGGPRTGQQLVDGGGRVILHTRKHVGEVIEGIDRARLAGGNERDYSLEARAREVESSAAFHLSEGAASAAPSHLRRIANEVPVENRARAWER
jgi:hypothetical protein